MQSYHRFLSVVSLTLLSASSFAATTTYTSAASFLPQVTAGSYLENFNSFDDEGPATFSSGGFSYAVSATSGIYGSGEFIGSNQPYEVVTISFTSGNVTAVGGNFFATDISDSFFANPVTLTLSDATTVTFTPSSLLDSYRGFTSDVVITSLTLTVPTVAFNSRYPALDNLTVGVAVVPEPSSWLLMGLGVAGLAAVARRRRV